MPTKTKPIQVPARVEPRQPTPGRYVRIVLDRRKEGLGAKPLASFQAADDEGIARARLFRVAFVEAVHIWYERPGPDSREALQLAFGSILGKDGLDTACDYADYMRISGR